MADAGKSEPTHDSTFIATLAGRIDRLICDTIQANIEGHSMDETGGAALSIAVAGLIAGRAEETIEGDAEAIALFDTCKQSGREAVAALRAAKTKH